MGSFDPRHLSTQQGPMDMGMVAQQAVLMEQQQVQQGRAASVQLAIQFLSGDAERGMSTSNAALIATAATIHTFITTGK